MLQPLSAEWVASWRADLATLRDTLPRVHPNPYHRTSAISLSRALDALGSSLPSLDHYSAAARLAAILATIGEGHTRLTLPLDTAAGFFTGHSPTAPPKIPSLMFQALPIRIEHLADGYFVSSATRSHLQLLGARIDAINGVGIDSVASLVRPFIHGDNDSQKAGLTPDWLVLPAMLRAAGVGNSIDRATVTFEAGGGATAAVLHVVPQGAAVEWEAASVLVPKRMTREGPHTRLVIRPGTRTAILSVAQVMEDGDGSFARISDSLSVLVARGDVDRLVIDLRGNPGGDTFLFEPITRAVERSSAFRRPGALFVLTDQRTFSAAVNASAELERRTSAIFIGATTAGDPNSFSDARRIVLPRTGLTVRVSTLYWQATEPSDRRGGIVPLVRAAQSSGPWRLGTDAGLALADSLSEASGTAAGTWRGTLAARHERLNLMFELGSASGRLLLAGGGARALTHSEVIGSRVRFGWQAAEGRWEVDAYAAGTRLVGVARYKGWEFPLVLDRQP